MAARFRLVSSFRFTVRIGGVPTTFILEEGQEVGPAVAYIAPAGSFVQIEEEDEFEALFEPPPSLYREAVEMEKQARESMGALR